MDPRRAEEIEGEARKLRLDLDRRRSLAWDIPPEDQIDRIDPFKIATHLLGVRLVEDDEFRSIGGDLRGGNLPTRIGGYIDRTNNTIYLSKHFRVGTRRFTLAHLIGHWQLHNGSFHDGPRMAGDRPTSARDSLEQEANLFAEELLMPQGFVKRYFQRVLQVETLRFRSPDEMLARWLKLGTGLRVTPADLVMKGRDHIALLAAEWSPQGEAPSLAVRFKVASLAMAIRLQRLRLI